MGRFEATDLAHGATSAAKGHLKDVGGQIKRVLDHHIRSIAESPQVHR
jgi:hypothetical protein